MSMEFRLNKRSTYLSELSLCDKRKEREREQDDGGRPTKSDDGSPIASGHRVVLEETQVVSGSL